MGGDVRGNTMMDGGVNTFVIYTLLGAKELKVMTTVKN